MEIRTRKMWAAALVAFIAPGLAASEPIVVGSHVSAYQASRQQVRLVRWAVSRYEDAGLEAPRVEIHFHGDESGCDGHVAFALGGRVDICDTLVNAMTRHLVLHETGHIWLDQNLTPPTRERFLRMRGLRAWNSSTDPWELRGYEQAAEILAWGLGERILTPMIPDNDPERIAASYELLTGTSIPRAAI
jgi:hypothetical protein